jgi:hypothetical protein
VQAYLWFTKDVQIFGIYLQTQEHGTTNTPKQLPQPKQNTAGQLATQGSPPRRWQTLNKDETLHARSPSKMSAPLPLRQELGNSPERLAHTQPIPNSCFVAQHAKQPSSDAVVVQHALESITSGQQNAIPSGDATRPFQQDATVEAVDATFLPESEYQDMPASFAHQTICTDDIHDSILEGGTSIASTPTASPQHSPGPSADHAEATLLKTAEAQDSQSTQATVHAQEMLLDPHLVACMSGSSPITQSEKSGTSEKAASVPLKLATWNLRTATLASAAPGASGGLSSQDPSPIALPDNYKLDASSHHSVRPMPVALFHLLANVKLENI